MSARILHSRALMRLVAATALVCASAGQVAAQSADRVLGREDIQLLGAGLAVEPARQTVPKDIATIVSTFLSAPTMPDDPLPPFAPDALVKATLRGPSFSAPVEISTRPNTPFNIPPLSVAGVHTLDGIRLESGGDVILRGAPESVVIDVIEKLLVTQVTARALTADEIRERGIVFDRTNFQAYNFTAAFAVGAATPIPISFPIVLPKILPTPGVSLNEVGLPAVDVPNLPSLRTIIPDTLQLQTQIPNLSVVGFTLSVPQLQGQELTVPPIPGIVVIPGDIGFLNQYFNVTLLVGNVAPIGSGLVVTGLSAEVVLPAGRDQVPNSGDDPLRMAQTAAGESPRVKLVVQPGPDGKLGTADDIGSLAPGDSGSAEYLVEGRREGSHVIEMEMTGTLHGLPVGPVTVRGRAAGTVLVRNPTFTLTFTHPELINAGEPYSLDVTVTNTSASPANFVSVNLHSRNITGATVVGPATREIDSIAPGDSTTVSFDLIAQVTGPIRAATLDSDDNVNGRFALKTSVGELGIPLSPDSLVLPKEANSLPASLRNAALGLLGKAWAVATAPAAALPADVSRFSKKIVYDRAIELAETGFRYSLHEPLADASAHLLLDYLGNTYARLAERTPQPSALLQAQSDYRGFDELRRRSIRGEVLADAVAANIAPDLAAAGPEGFHRAFGEKMSFRPGHVSVLLSSGSAPLPFTLSLIDSGGRRVGGLDAAGRVIKNIPFGELLTFAGTPAAQMALIGSPEPGAYTIQLDRVAGAPDTPFTLSLLVPDAAGALRQVVFNGLTSSSRPNPVFAPSDPIRLTVSVRIGGTTTAGPATPAALDVPIVDPAPSLIAAVQQRDADVLACEDGGIWRVGRVIAVLFSEEVTPEAVQDRVRAADLTRYLMEDNQVVGVALQPGRRIAFLALRDPVGPLVARTITISNVTDRLGQPMPAQAVPIEMTVDDEAAVVTGQVLRADGTPAPFTNVRLYYVLCNTAVARGISTRLDTSGEGISSKTTDADGRFQWDFVLKNVVLNRIAAIDVASGEARTVPFTISRHGQRLNVNVVFLGRGTLSGRTLSETGAPLANTAVKVTSLTDDTEYGATSDAQGRFTINRIPVGNIFVEAVNPQARAKGTIAEYLSIANGTVTRDITLFAEDTPRVDVQYGTLRGYVLRGDGQGAVDVPVIAYYKSESQRGVRCPGAPAPGVECAIAVVRTSATGEFVFDRIPAGNFRVSTFDRATYQQGEAGIILAANTTQTFNILLAQGLSTIRGVVLDATGARVPGARVGGGLSLTTADNNGEFVLIDVPVGRREIVAVSDALNSSGRTMVDLVRAGDEQNVTVVLDGVGSVAGRVFRTNGVTPIGNVSVHLFKECGGGCIEVVGSTTTDPQGGYTFTGVKLGQYRVSSFLADFSEGNVMPAPLVFVGQVARINIIHRGGGGRITGVVYDDDGQTPLQANVGISGDRVVVAGGQVGVGFQHVQNYQVTQTNFTTGAFAFDGIWVGPVTLRAVGQFSPDPIPFSTAIPSPGAQVHVELRLQATAQIAGTVFLPDGVTPAGADVIVRYKSNAYKLICDGDECAKIPQGVQDFTVVTDAQGRYLINPVNAGPFTITVEDPATGRVAQVLGETKPAQDAEYDIRLLQLAAVTVRVRGSDGVTPIPNARVELRQVGFPNRAITVNAGANGDAVFSGGNALAEGTFAVLATNLQNGFAGRVSGEVTAETETVTITLFLFDAYGRVVGTVFGPDGLTPVPNAEVLVANEDGPIAFAVTDAAGAYSTNFVPLGDVDVEAFEAATSRRAFASGRVDFDDQEVPINLSQLGLGQVTGTLYEAGTLTPLKNWDVTLSQRAPSGREFPTLRTSSGVDGGFSFPGATVGAFRVGASKVRINAHGSAEGDIVRHGQVVDVPVVVFVPRAINGRIAGRVVNPDGSAAANSTITASIAGVLTPIVTTAGADGAFTFNEIPVGRVSLIARSQTSRNEARLQTEVQFEGETIEPTIVLVGLTQITGTVYRSDGVTPASFVAVELRGQPASGCVDIDQVCRGNADAAGRFSFDDVPARTFTVIAVDAISGLKGVVGDAVNPGGTRDVRIVLEPSAAVTGRVLLPGNVPAQGVVIEVVIDKPNPQPDVHLFEVTDANGAFTFPAVPSGGPRTFTFDDPIGPGVATRSVQVLSGTQSLGDVLLDVGPPTVAASAPAAAAVGVPLGAVVRLTFNEPVAPGSVTQANVTVTHAGGTVAALLTVDEGDTRVTIAPIAPLLEKTIYSVSVRNVTDRIGKPMTTPFILSFTSVDLTPPVVSALSPGAGTNGAPIYAPIRVTYSEPVDATRFTGAALALFDGATAVAGQFDLLFGNTVAVFTPSRPLREDATYRVTGQPAVDLSGNAQAQGLDYTFTTTDRTPPVITALVPAGDGTVIENAVTQVIAQAGAGHDVAFVDFYVNGVLTFTSRTEPFTLNLLARPELGAPGSVITVAAVATDTSGNRGTTPVSAGVTIVADTPPVVSIVSPAPNASFRNGDRVNVTVRVTDNLGATQLGYRAETGRPQDAATLALTPAATFREETFGFNVPASAAPGSQLRITASALDTKGQSSAANISLLILDAVPPTVAITGTTTGARVRPGQDTLVVVSAQDAGSIRELSFEATGAVARSEVRTVNPAQPDVATSFTIHVPETANAGDVIVLRARAVDVAGNATDAAPVTLPVADLNGPTVTLATDTGLPVATPGRSVTVIVNAEDETGVTRVDLSGQGAFSLTDVRAISPPIASAAATFTINVPAGATPGSTLTLAATATDLFGNVGQPGTLVLTVQAAAGVTMPPSLLTYAGDETDVLIELSDPAPAAGLTVTLVSTNANIVTAAAPVTFTAGQTTASARILSIAGGNATINAFVQGVQRAGMTVTVQGGVVRGRVVDPDGVPVAGAQVSVTPPLRVTTTDANGDYLVQGIAVATTTPIIVKVIDPVTRFIGYATGQINVLNGSARINAVLIAAGRISGTVLLPDGETLAGPGVRVNLLAPSNLNVPLQTVFTNDDSEYEFPLVTLGTYAVDALDTNGNRGRATAALAESGEEITVPVQYLGRGVVTGTVRSGGVPAPNAALIFNSSSVFGSGPRITRNADADGTFRFDGVFIGTFTVQASDPVSSTAGTTTGQISVHEQTVTADVALTTYGELTGQVLRPDGATPVAGAEVTARGVRVITNEDGIFVLPFLPLGNYTLEATEGATRSIGRATGTLATHLQVITQNVVFLAQGSVVATVRDFNGALVPGASVRVIAQNGQITDVLTATTAANGVAIVERVLVGTVNVSATANGLSSPPITRTLTAGEVLNVSLTIEATANIVGTLFGPDGQTPVTNGFVARNASGIGLTPVNPDGTFRYDGLDLGTYRIYGYDVNRRLRAAKEDIELTQNGVDVVSNLSLVGLGSVIGRVVNPNGSPAGNLMVQVQSLHPQFGGFYSDATDANGNYEILNRVAAGPFAVTTGSGSLRGEATGAVALDGEVVRRDIALVNSAVSLPVTLRDANNGLWDVRQGGHSGSSLHNAFVAGGTAAAPQGGFVLEILSGATTTPFVGDTTFGTTEDGSREIAVRQQVTPIAGLSVTRKTFVPISHFARYLEMLTNPTAAPITVGVRIRSSLNTSGSSISPVLASTSSGDAVLDVSTADTADRWAVVRLGTDGDSFAGGSFRASFAWVFDGPGAPQRASTVTLSTTGNPRVLAYTWENVTIQPGQTVGFLHFGAQQYNQAAAIASAERLVQLPPEVLTGLSPDEIAAIQNFVVPADATSPLAPLPGFGTSVTGRVLEADGTTPIGSPTSTVRLRSSLIYFGRQYTVLSNAAGNFTFTASPGSTNQISLPLANFTLDATHSGSNLVSSPATGSFASGTLTTTRDVAYTNGATIGGDVRRHNGAIVTIGGTARLLIGTSLLQTVNFAADGRFRLTGVAPGTYTLDTFLNVPPGGNPTDQRLTGGTTITTTAGQAYEQDLTIVPTGGLTGTLRTSTGGILTNRAVLLRVGTTTHRTVTTSTAGVFLFTDVPAGAYTLRANDPVSGLFTDLGVVITQDQTLPQDLTLVGFGTVPVTVVASDGTPLANSTVSIRRSTDAPTATPGFAGNTDAAGQVTIQNVPVGAFLIQAQYPQVGQVVVDVNGNMPAHGAVVPTQITLPSVSTLLVQVRTTEGTPVSGASVTIRREGSTQFTNAANTNAAGERTFTQIWGTYTIRVQHPTFGSGVLAEVTGAVTVNAQTIPVPVVMPVSSSITGTVLDTNGAPVSGVAVRFRSTDFGFTGQATTNQGGQYVIAAAPGGRYLASAIDTISNPDRGGFAETAVVASGQLTVDFVLDDFMMPGALIDGNARSWGISSSGLIDSTPGFSSGKYSLHITTPASPQSFQFDNWESTVGKSGLAGREVELVRHNLTAGLDVRRKLFLPVGGYFLRYLEIIDNRDSVARTFRASGFDENLGTYQHTVQATSSGDQIIGPEDHWRVTGRTAATARGFAHVLTGPGGEIALATAASAPSTGSPSFAWSDITLQPGEKAALMHFVVSSRSPAAAQEAAQRLVQLPPEALDGLTEEEIAIIRNFDVPEDGSSLPALHKTFSGTVYSGDGITPAAGLTVTLTSANGFKDAAQTAVTNSSGQYSMSYPAGPSYSLSVTLPMGGAPTVVTGSVAPEDTAIVRDIVLSNQGALRGVVRMNGAVVTTGTVRIQRRSTSLVLTAPIQSDGSFQFAALSVASYDLTATTGATTSPVTRLSIDAGTVTVRDIQMVHFPGSIAVRVVAADGVTPLPPGRLYAYDAVTFAQLADEIQPDADGIYRPPPFAAPYGFELSIYVPDTYADAYAAYPPFSAPNQTVDITMVSTASVLRGVVSEFDGTPVAGAAVVARQVIDTSDGPDNRVYSSELTDADGRYLIFGVEQGPFVLQATDAEPGLLTAELTAEIDAPAATVNISLPEAGSVSVATFAGGNSVTLTSNAFEPGIYMSAQVDPDLGRALFERVPMGRFSVQVCHDESRLACGAANGHLQSSAQPLDIAIAMPELLVDGFVGTLVDADGVTPVANETVLVSAGEMTPEGGVEYVTTDAAGQFQSPFALTAQGLLVVSAESMPALSAQFSAGPGPFVFTMERGTAISSTTTLTGTLPFQYVFGGNASVEGGGTPNLRSVFESYNQLQLNGLAMSGAHAAAGVELDGRQVAYAATSLGGLQVTRKVYVPEDGSYVRYLEILHNPAGGSVAGPITTELQLQGQLEELYNVVRPATDTGGAYFVVDHEYYSRRTVMADVLSATTGAATLFPTARMPLFGGAVTKRYTVTVPDGETRIVMHFVVQRLEGDHAGAEAQAQSLVNLTDPNMFTGLSAAERAQVVNFRVP